MSDDPQIQVRFGADASGLKEGADQAKDAIKDFGSSTDEITNKLIAMGEAIAGAFTVEKLAEFVKGTAEAAETIERLHNITGFSTDSIQTLQYAMQRLGIDSGSAQMMLSRFERNLDQAASGTGPAFDAFTKLGISLEMLQHGAPDEVFRRMADGFKNLSDPAARADVAIALLGRSGAALIPVLRQGSAGLDDMGRRLDATHDRLDPGSVEAFSHLNKSIIDMGKAFEGAMRTAITPFAELIDRIIQGITKLTEGITNLGGSLAGMAKNAGMMIQLMGMSATGKTGSPSGFGGSEEFGPPAPPEHFNRSGLSGGKGNTSDKDISSQRQVYAEQYDVKKEYDALMVQSSQMTHQQEFTDLQAALLKEQALIDKSFDQQMAEYAKDSVEYQALQNQKSVADQKFQIEHMKLTQEATKQDMKQWTLVANTIEKNFDSMIKGMMQGTQTFQQAFQRLAQNLVISLEEAMLKMVGDWLKTELQKTAATIAGNTTRVASDQAAANSSAKSNSGSASSQIMQDAYEAAANVYANVSAIPYVGWILAPPAAAAAFAAVAAFDSFEVGTPNVPKTGLAMLHQGEAVVPKGQAQAWRDGDLGLGAGGGDTHFHFHTLDSSNVAKMLKANHKAIADGVKAAARGGSGSLRSAFAGL